MAPQQVPSATTDVVVLDGEVTVTTHRIGRGARYTVFTGKSFHAVQNASERAWQNADPWLRTGMPKTMLAPGGYFMASFTVANAE